MHVWMIENMNGDLTDIMYYCSQACADDAGAPRPTYWPGGMGTDYCLFCDSCGNLVEHGLECECFD